MNKVEFIKSMSFLGIAYNKQYNENELEVLYTFFYDVDVKIFNKAIKRICVKEKYIPSVARLREEIVNIVNPSIELNAEEEFSKVMHLISVYGRNRYDEAMKCLDEVTVRAVKQVGWTKMCNSTFIANEHRQFITIFDNLKVRDKNDMLYKLSDNVVNLIRG